MLTKIKWDVENTAQAFTDVKKYRRARRWADIARPYLRLFESLIISEAPDLEDLNIKIDKIHTGLSRISRELPVCLSWTILCG